MTLAVDVVAQLIWKGVELRSLAHLWPLGESPVPAVGMLWLTSLVTWAPTPAAALHSIIDILWQTCGEECEGRVPVLVDMYAVWDAYFWRVSSEVVLTLDTCLIKQCWWCLHVPLWGINPSEQCLITYSLPLYMFVYILISTHTILLKCNPKVDSKKIRPISQVFWQLALQLYLQAS